MSQYRDLLFVFSDNQSGKDKLWRKFWTLAREAGHTAAAKAIPSLPCWDYKRWWEDVPGKPLKYEEQELLQSLSSWHYWLHLLTGGGSWRPFSGTLLPGPIVPADGSRDADIAIDVEFHVEDLELLRDLGSVDAPTEVYPLSPFHRYKFLKRCREEYRQRSNLPHRPDWARLNFANTTTGGPLEVLKALSEDARVAYTWCLLDLEDTYKPWALQHDTQSNYPPKEFESPALEALREHGRIRTHAGIQKLSAGLGSEPEDPDVLDHLRQHPKARLICHAFDLEPASDPTVEPIGQDDTIPLLDIWPGLKPHLTQEEANFQLIRCDGLKNKTGRIDGTITDSTEDEQVEDVMAETAVDEPTNTPEAETEEPEPLTLEDQLEAAKAEALKIWMVGSGHRPSLPTPVSVLKNNGLILTTMPRQPFSPKYCL